LVDKLLIQHQTRQEIPSKVKDAKENINSTEMISLFLNRPHYLFLDKNRNKLHSGLCVTCYVRAMFIHQHEIEFEVTYVRVFLINSIHALIRYTW